MDISCIISSGDLELYVLGMLSQEDNLKVAQLAQLFPEIKKEIDDIEQSLLQLGEDMDATELPSPSVRTNLFSKLSSLPYEAETANGTDFTSDSTDKDLPADIKEGKMISMQQPKRNTFSTLMLAASVIALIACIAVITHLSSANKHYHEVANNMQRRVNQLEQTTTAYQQSLQMYQSPDFLKINLTNPPGKPNALVQLFWNKNTHDVYVADISLPQAPAGKQYQLWAIVDGKPVNAGVLSAKKTPQQMVNFVKADAFAITLEKAGGSPTPTLTEMYVIGKPS